LRDAPIIPLDNIHSISWQITIDNNLLYANPEEIYNRRMKDDTRNRDKITLDNIKRGFD
jgi:adenylate kinase